MTKDRIRATKVFSANLVTEELLAVADYFGNTEGYNENKMRISVETEKGRVLDVPVLVKSPWVYELEVDRSIALDDGQIFLLQSAKHISDGMVQRLALGVSL